MAFIRPDGNDNELNRPAEVAGARPRGWYRGDASDNPGTILRAPDVNEALGNNRELTRYAGIDLSARTAPDDTILRDAVIAAAARGMFFKRAADPTNADVLYADNGLQLAYPVGSRWYNTTDDTIFVLLSNDGVSADWRIEKQESSSTAVLWSGNTRSTGDHILNIGRFFSNYQLLEFYFRWGGDSGHPAHDIISPSMISIASWISGRKLQVLGSDSGEELSISRLSNSRFRINRIGTPQVPYLTHLIGVNL